jgi:hypothetical protein
VNLVEGKMEGIMMKNIAFGAVVFTLLVSAAISSAIAYQNQWFPPQRSGITEGAPCPGISRSGRSAHYVWMPGYVQKGKWRYHWACVD